MVTLAQPAGTFGFWPQNNSFLPYGSVVPCQWHGLPAVTANCTPVKQHSFNVCSPYVSPLPVQPHLSTTSISSTSHRCHPHYQLLATTPLSPLSQSTRTVDPEKPIGYGSFGVVWSVVNTQEGTRAALKKIPNVFQSLLACIRTFREVKILCELKHENLLSSTDFIHPPPLEQFNDVLVLCDLMESDLHQIIVSPQKLSEDHVKVFIYQILRGLKYLHSADIIHRDLKPGNLLVNSNCLLKICDFGFARAVEPDPNTAMTLEVVTQYYRAPELLAGCKHYDTAIDMWSVGCILAELLGRRILFEASSPETQLEMIIDLLGTPVLEDMSHITSSAAVKSLVSQAKPSALSKLYQLSSDISHSAVHLLSQMLIFNPVKRLNCSDALVHPFLEDGKMRYHTYLCSCCHTSVNGTREFTREFEPNASYKFDPSYEKDLTSIARARVLLHEYIRCVRPHLSPLYINIYAKHFKKFQGCCPGVPQLTINN